MALITLQRTCKLRQWLALVAWHLQPIVLALAFLPQAIAGKFSAQDIPLAVALGVELVFLVAVDWQQAIQHAQAHEGDHLREPLLQDAGVDFLIGGRQNSASATPLGSGIYRP